ncbi:MAG: hypothetical protein KGL39_05195 [Patescibacteria group bacterium]|nr:hypothetical protein [Patescibacteria group bacterium]
MSDFRWLIEAPGPNYLSAYNVAMSHEFYWTRDANKALAFRNKDQADAVMMAVRQLAPSLFTFALQLGDAKAVEHGFLENPSHDRD